MQKVFCVICSTEQLKWVKNYCAMETSNTVERLTVAVLWLLASQVAGRCWAQERRLENQGPLLLLAEDWGYQHHQENHSMFKRKGLLPVKPAEQLLRHLPEDYQQVASSGVDAALVWKLYIFKNSLVPIQSAESSGFLSAKNNYTI